MKKSNLEIFKAIVNNYADKGCIESLADMVTALEIVKDNPKLLPLIYDTVTTNYDRAYKVRVENELRSL